MDIGVVRLVVSHGAAVHGLPISVEQVDFAWVALRRLGCRQSNERPRRPTEDEPTKLIVHFEEQTKISFPMGAIIKFAIAIATRAISTRHDVDLEFSGLNLSVQSSISPTCTRRSALA